MFFLHVILPAIIFFLIQYWPFKVREWQLVLGIVLGLIIIGG